MKNRVDLFIQKKKEFLEFLKSRYNLFHLSNIFFRDVHYGVMAFLKMNRLPDAYIPAEELAHQVIAAYEQEGLLTRIDEQSWMLNYPPFKKLPAKPVAPPAKVTPATQMSPAAKPAVVQEVHASTGPGNAVAS